MYCSTLALTYDVLFSFMLYYIQLKGLNILWGPGAEGRAPDAGYEGRGPDNPNTRLKLT